MSSPKNMKFAMHICTHTYTRIHVHTHTSAGQSAWHQTAVHSQMRCVRAPCCQEADRKKKQTLSNGDMTCSPGRKLKQTINGPWSLQYSSKIPTIAPPLCSPSLSLCPMLAEGVRHFKTQASAPRRHISATPLPQFYRDPWTGLSGQHNVNTSQKKLTHQGRVIQQ